jgi:ribulose-5-phosphate 4-epimerase/fuculose-1-phosphate aldolase
VNARSSLQSRAGEAARIAKRLDGAGAMVPQRSGEDIASDFGRGRGGIECFDRCTELDPLRGTLENFRSARLAHGTVQRPCGFQLALPVYTYASMTRPLSKEETASIGGRATYFSQMTARDLLLLSSAANEEPTGPGAPDRTAWALHSYLHRNVPRAQCILHTHMPYATAWSCLEDPEILPICQNTACGMFVDHEEPARVAELLGEKEVMLLGGHGVMVVGQTVAHAFDTLYHLERACMNLVLAHSTDKQVRRLPHEVAEKNCASVAGLSRLLRRAFPRACRDSRQGGAGLSVEGYGRLNIELDVTSFTRDDALAISCSLIFRSRSFISGDCVSLTVLTIVEAPGKGPCTAYRHHSTPPALEGSANRGEVDYPALIAGRRQALPNNPQGTYQLFRIGDTVASRNIHAAIYDGLRFAKAF